MIHTYVVKRGDSLAKVAKNSYGDIALWRPLAAYNGILNPDLIRVGQVIEVPSRRELNGTSVTASPRSGLATPNGLQEIITTFGDIFQYIGNDGALDPRWENTHFTRAPLPFGVPLSWDLKTKIDKIFCHTKLAQIVTSAFEQIERTGLREHIKTYGGCYSYRPKRSSNKLSVHSWGIAIDLNPDSNPMGAPGDMDTAVVEVFRQFGFKWGGDWPGRSRDPMHFQFCTGY